MDETYAYSLVPVISIALLLCFESLVHSPKSRSMALYCLSIALWTGLLFVSQMPKYFELQNQWAGFGVLVSATHTHAMFDHMEWKGRSRWIIWFGYLVGFLATFSIAFMYPFVPNHITLQSGPWSLPAMAVAGLLFILPLEAIVRSAHLTGEHRRKLSILIIAGVLCFIGAWGTLLLLSIGRSLPYGMFLVLLSLLFVGHLFNIERAPHHRRLLERSYLYTAIAALLSAFFLFGVLWLLSSSFRPDSKEYYISVLFMFFMAALAFEPLRQSILERFGRTFLKHRTSMTDIAKEFAAQEERADQAERLAELGSFVSAVAHEVRNPLGVLAAYMGILRRKGVEETTLSAMQEQINRANHFINDLLSYGRPRPLELRTLTLTSHLTLAFQTAKNGIRGKQPDIIFENTLPETITIEADQGQLSQVFVILFENALQALKTKEGTKIQVKCEPCHDQIELSIHDDGPGLPEGQEEQIFAPFFTTRKRDTTHMNSGLGLAIAKGIIERHHGTILATTSPLGGACFLLKLPIKQQILAAAPSHHTKDTDT